MAQMSSAFTDTLFLEVLIAVFILMRSVRTYYGRALSVPRLVIFPVLATVLWSAAEASTAYSIPSSFPLWTTIDAALVVAGAFVTLPIAPRLISVYQTPDGQWMYRYGIELIAFYLTSWIVRLALAAYFDPSSLQFTYTTGPPLSALAAAVMQVVEVLFSISTGLLIGRTVGTYRLYRSAVARAPPRSVPLP
jgi:hypothetical protein